MWLHFPHDVAVAAAVLIHAHNLKPILENGEECLLNVSLL